MTQPPRATESPQASPLQRHVPRAIWTLGFVSLFMDASSELVHSLLPMFLVGSLGASATIVGVIDGIAEALTPLIKTLSGLLSDYLGHRKWLAVAGYGLSALSKPLFALAPTSGVVLAARIADRTGKGIRGAPRDALVADITPPHLRGAAYGLRQALDTVGAFIGPLLAVVIMELSADNFRLAFWLAGIPALASVALLAAGIREPAATQRAPRVNPFARSSLAKLGGAYWWVVFVGAAFALARFSEAFLVLRAMKSGVPVAFVPLVLVAMNIVYALAAYPFGKLADSMSHTKLLASGLFVLIAADMVLAHGTQWPVVLFGVLLWGLHMAMTQGLLATMVAQTAPADLKGTAFGFFNLMSGVALLIASVVAGELWDRLGPQATFYAGAAFALLTLAALAAKGYVRHRADGS